MAYNAKKLVLKSQTLGHSSSWQYESADTKAVINSLSYFDDASLRLRVNDIIEVTHTTGGTVGVCTMFVNANSTAGVVDVTDGADLSLTDSD